MSRKVDEHVVEMRFNNSDFEKKTAQTMSTLDKLKEKLNFSSNVKGLDDTVNHLNSLNNVNLSGLQKTISVVDMSLSAIAKNTIFTDLTQSAINFAKKIGRTVTTPINQIITGGKSRAKNIEQAKFQLEGLGVAWSSIEEDINYGVKDTAYGLDSAARVASQLVASQVKLGSEMKSALRGISGVAAMTNSSYDDIGSIFTTVAGNGKLMTMQLQQLAGRGLNAAAALAKYLGKSEAEIREMTSKGKIDFNTFAKAMNETFGDHAKEANKTFDGALSNIKAALSRLGADVATSGFESLRQIMVDLIPVINTLKKAADPFISTISKCFLDFAEAASYAIDGLKRFLFVLDKDGNVIGGPAADLFLYLSNKIDYFSWTIYKAIRNLTDHGGLLDFFKSIQNVISFLFLPLKLMARAFFNVFDSPFDNLSTTIKKFREFTDRLVLSVEASQGLERIFTAFFIVLKYGLNILQKFKDFLKPLIREIGNLIIKFLEFVGTADTSKLNIFDKMFNNKLVSTIKETIPKALGGIVKIIGSLYKKVIDVFDLITKNEKYKNVVKTIKKVFGDVEKFFINGFKKIGNVGDFSKVIDGFNTDTLADGFAKVLEIIGGLFVKVKEFFGLFKTGKDDIKEVRGEFKLINNFAEKINDLSSNKTENQNGGFLNKIFGDAGTFDKLSEIISKNTKIIFQNIKTLISSIDAGMLITEAFGIFTVLMIKNIGGAAKSVGDLSDSIKRFFDGLSGKFKFKQPEMSPLMKVITIVGIIAAAIIGLALMYKYDSEAFSVAVTVVSCIGIAVTAMGIVLSKMKEFPMGAVKASKTVISLCKGLLMVAIAISALTFVFSKADPESSKRAVAAIQNIIGELFILTLAISKIDSKGKAIQNVSSMLALCFALHQIVLAIAGLTVLFSLKPNETLIAVGSIVLIILAFYAASSKLAGQGNKINVKAVFKTGLQILSIAGAFLMIASAINILSKITFDKNVVTSIVTASAILIGIFVATALLTKFADKDINNTMYKVAAQVLAMSSSLLLIAATLKILEGIKWSKNLSNNLAAVLGLITIIGGVGVVLSLLGTQVGDPSKTIKSLYGLIGIITAMSLVIALLQRIVSNKNFDTAVATLAAITGLIVVLGITFANLGESKNDWKKISAMCAGIATLIGVFAASLMLLCLPDTNKLLGASAALAISMVACGIIISAISNLNLEGNSILKISLLSAVLSILIGTICGSLVALAKLPFDNIMGAALALVGVLITITVVMKVFEGIKSIDPSIALTLLALSVAFISFGISMNILAEGLAKVCSVIQNGTQLGALIAMLIGLTVFIVAISASLLALSKAGLSVIPVGLTLAGVFLSVALTFASLAAIIASVAAVLKILGSGFKYLVENVDLIGVSLLKAIDYFMMFMLKLRDNALQIGVLGGEIGVSLVGGILTGLVTGVAKVASKLKDVGSFIAKSIWNGIKGKETDLSELDKIIGISKDVSKAVDQVGTDTTNSISTALTKPFTDANASDLANGFMGDIQNTFDNSELTANIIPDMGNLQSYFDGQQFDVEVIPTYNSSDLDFGNISADLNSNLDLTSINNALNPNQLGITALSNDVKTTGNETNNLTKTTNNKLDTLNQNIINLQNRVNSVESKIGNLRIYADSNSIVAMVDKQLGSRYQRNTRNTGRGPSLKKAYS